MHRFEPLMGLPHSWRLDPDHSRAELSVSSGTSALCAHFAAVRGSLVFQESEPSRVEVRVEIDTRDFSGEDAEQTAALASASFLDSARHPALSLRSRSAEPEENGTLRILADLSFRGVRRLVALRCEIRPTRSNELREASLDLRMSGAFEASDFGLLPSPPPAYAGPSWVPLIILRVAAVAVPWGSAPEAA